MKSVKVTYRQGTVFKGDSFVHGITPQIERVEVDGIQRDNVCAVTVSSRVGEPLKLTLEFYPEDYSVESLPYEDSHGNL